MTARLSRRLFFYGWECACVLPLSSTIESLHVYCIVVLAVVSDISVACVWCVCVRALPDQLVPQSSLLGKGVFKM
jgi:hypothetical protein